VNTSPSIDRPCARSLPRVIARLISADARSYRPFDKKSVAIAYGDESMCRTAGVDVAGVLAGERPVNNESSDWGSKLKSGIDPSAAGRAPPRSGWIEMSGSSYSTSIANSNFCAT
jgi:hypothetical protein